ncbi:hypothetical protein ACN9MZ_10970 [Pseudoduganella sp. S-14]|uniref:hypothetical protein n=1 Tax=Pseudoduganella sp. S-14 TaxID=3404065 RepID=UPI003CF417C2
MSDNVYAAPSANLDEHFHSSEEDRFYVVSTRKMLILFFLTFGLFQLHWNFQNWQRHKRATGDDVWPLPRALFALFFTHTLYHEVADYDPSGKGRSWNSDTYATGMVFLMLAGYALSWAGTGSLLLDVVSILLLIPTGLLLKRVQLEINIRSGDPAGSSNDNFTAANIVWCVLGALAWFFFAIGLLLVR